jgi:hypothetical protein
MKMVDLTNLREDLEKIFMQTLYERLPKSDNVSQGAHKDNVHVEQPSIKNHIPGRFDLNNVNN